MTGDGSGIGAATTALLLRCLGAETVVLGPEAAAQRDTREFPGSTMPGRVVAAAPRISYRPT
ncbi:hypothetical protein [Actinoplanes subtropicus]|uniref:hypothetical protein n=1 Tax=Actinoplanes subtropicus TaxID=543632 RepID=UPI000B1C4940|nr:hypothetical protein [Actinoplanes subtropicus]